VLILAQPASEGSGGGNTQVKGDENDVGLFLGVYIGCETHVVPSWSKAASQTGLLT
jgi:hypothetical protein